MTDRLRQGHQYARVASLIRRAVLILAVVVATGVPAAAQGVPRAFRGLFRISDDVATERHRVDLIASPFLGVVRADVSGAASPDDELIATSSYQGVSATLSYAFQGRLTSFESISGGTFQHYSTLPGFRATRYYERVQVVSRFKPRTTFRLGGGATYSPYYALSVAADPEGEEGALAVPAGGQEPVISVRENLRLDGQIELTHRPSPRSEVAVHYAIADTRFLKEDFALATHRAGLRYSRGLTEHARLQLGYVYHQWRYAGVEAPTLRGHDVRVGVGYNRTLPFSPRTRFGFDFGSVGAQQPGSIRFDLSGTAFLARQLGRDWLTAASYSRGFDVRAGFVEPLYYFFDTAALSLGGTVARRAAVRVVGSYSRGRFTAGVREDRFRSWSGTAGISVGVARVLSLNAQATASTLRFSSGTGPRTGLPSFVDGLALVSGLTVWFPVLR